ncbi:MAG: class IV adenylate cyclase [Candidatus Taylorbacteria bacterium]
MKEIEVKARLRDKKAVVKKLKSIGCVFEVPVTQSDTVYAKVVGTVSKYLSSDVFLRIRVKNGKKIFFTVKKPLSNGLDKLEYEVVVNSKVEIEQAILLMGYKKAVEVNKTRIVAKYKEREICIDEVQNLGTFIEVEELRADGDSEKIQDELFAFVESLGVSREDRVFSGYDILMLQKLK